MINCETDTPRRECHFYQMTVKNICKCHYLLVIIEKAWRVKILKTNPEIIKDISSLFPVILSNLNHWSPTQIHPTQLGLFQNLWSASDLKYDICENRGKWIIHWHLVNQWWLVSLNFLVTPEMDRGENHLSSYIDHCFGPLELFWSLIFARPRQSVYTLQPSLL